VIIESVKTLTVYGRVGDINFRIYESWYTGYAWPGIIIIIIIIIIIFYTPGSKEHLYSKLS